MSRVSANRLTERTGHTGWRNRLLIAATVLAATGLSAIAPPASAADAPFVFEKTMKVPGVPVGPYSDHLTIDLVGKRVFATPQAARMVAVLDLQDGKVLKTMPVGNPHAVYYSSSLKRLFVTDSVTGSLLVYSGDDYSLIKEIRFEKGIDWLLPDPNSQLLYVNHGGDAAGMDHAVVSVFDAAKLEKVADIAVPAPVLEGSALDTEKQLLYVNLNMTNSVAVVDLRKRETVAIWKLPPADGRRAMGATLDQGRSRLYVSTRDNSLNGSIMVLDTNDGRIVATLPIGGWADDIFIDQKRQRVYVTVGVGYVDTYAIEGGDAYRREPRVETQLMAKTGLFSRELDRMFVSVPTLGDFGSFEVMVFKPESK